MRKQGWKTIRGGCERIGRRKGSSIRLNILRNTQTKTLGRRATNILETTGQIGRKESGDTWIIFFEVYKIKSRSF